MTSGPRRNLRPHSRFFSWHLYPIKVLSSCASNYHRESQDPSLPLFSLSLFASQLALRMSISQVARFADRRAIATFFNVQCLLPTRKETSRETLSDLLAACSLHYHTRCVFRRHAFPALSFGVFVSRRAASLQRVTYTPVDSCTFIELFTHRFNEIGWCD